MTIRRTLAALPSGRLGKFLVLGGWLLLVTVATPLALKLSGARDNTALDALPGGSEAARAAARSAAAFPESDALIAVAVYARGSGLTQADRALVDADRGTLARYAEGGLIPPATASHDGQAEMLTFRLAGDDDTQTRSASAIQDHLAELAASGGGPAGGLRTALTGSAGAEGDVSDAFEGMDWTLLAATGTAVALLLLLTYRSPVLWLIPLLTVGVANQVAGAVVYLLAEHAGLAMDFQSQNILTVLLFGVGVDYALLLVARYREELSRHPDRHQAMATALRRSFPAVCASAATVALALLCLLVADLPATRGLGPVCAVGVVVALVAMTTLLPAILVIFGRWLFWPFVPRYSPQTAGRDVEAEHGMWARIAGLIGRRPRLVWISAVAGLAALSFGVTNLSVGMPGEEAFRDEVGSIRGQHLIAAHFPGGSSEPETIICEADAGEAVAAAARAVTGVAEVSSPERSVDGHWVRLRVVLSDGPESRAAIHTVERLRDAARGVPGARALIGGRNAEALDTERAVARDNRLVMPLVLVVVFLVLVVLLRSLVAPLLLLASVVGSYIAALGAAGLVLNAMGYTKLWAALPLQAFLFLVALGVDYTIFLMTRAREEVAARGHHQGIIRALTVTGGVVTSAGLVLAATFASLGVLPLVPSAQMGIIVAVGVLLDTLIVRTALVPALSLHIGPRTWWPSPLAR